MKRLFYTLLLFCFSVLVCSAQKFQVKNEFVERTLSFSNGHLTSESYKLRSSENNILKSISSEFSFTANDSIYSGQSDWKFIKCADTTSTCGGKGINLCLKSSDDRVAVKLTYFTYPEIAAVRKFITIENCGRDDLKIENVDVENLMISYDPTFSWTYHNFARDMVFGQYVNGDWNDALIILHDFPSHSGVVVGNESYGILKRTEAFSGGTVLKIGLTKSDNCYPFRKWLSPGQNWTSPAAFTIPYENIKNPQEVVSSQVQTLVRRHMGTQIEKRPAKPLLVYNTWVPFYRNVNEELIFELATATSECGFGEFIIDDGWQINLREDNSGKIYADWGIDTVKFPRGLKPVFDSIKSLGMKPGLWISVANCYKNGIAYGKHPEWIIKDKNGKITSLHSAGWKHPTACMATDWSDYIRDVILSYVKDYGLAYVKLDLAIITSAYLYDATKTGCYATDHKYHRDHAESYWAIYDCCMKMFDQLHEAAPELFIDCTFETAGKLQLMDYGISEHADGNWLSNIREFVPDGSLRARNMAWHRTPALHPTSLVIGNLKINDPQHIIALKSLTGTLPIMLGDPRTLSKEERAEYRRWSSWLNELESKHAFMSFRQDLRGFGEPQDGMWDGFSRINTETKSGGLVGVFRQDAPESSRVVLVSGLDDDSVYIVRKGCTNEVVAEMTGSELSNVGFKVEITDKIGAELFEVIKK